MKKFEISQLMIEQILDTVDAGLCRGMGYPEPGKMCVEAAICFSLGLPHSDDPGCVSQAVRKLKINLNDRAWSSNAARAVGLRRLAIAQLGSKDVVDDVVFATEVVLLAVRKYVPLALRAAKKKAKAEKALTLEEYAKKCENAVGLPDARSAAYAAAAAYAAYAADAAYAAADAANAAAYAAADANAAYAANAAAYAADAAADAANAAAYAADRDRVLSDFAEDVVQILVRLKSPGCEWLHLTEGK